MREHSTGLNPSLRVDSSLGALKSLAQIIVGLSAGEFKASIYIILTQAPRPPNDWLWFVAKNVTSRDLTIKISSTAYI